MPSDGGYVPAIAVSRTGFREGCEMRAQLKGAVIAVLEERLAVKPQELFCSLDGDPSSVFGHGAEKRVPIYGI